MDVTAFSSRLWAADQMGHTYAEKRFIVSLKFSVFPGGPSQVSMQASLGPTPLVSYSLFCCWGFSPRPLALTHQTLLTSLLSTACVWTSPRPVPEATMPCGCCLPNRGLQLSPDPDTESQLPTPWSERRLGHPSLTQSSQCPHSTPQSHPSMNSHPASQHRGEDINRKGLGLRCGYNPSDCTHVYTVQTSSQWMCTIKKTKHTFLF